MSKVNCKRAVVYKHFEQSGEMAVFNANTGSSGLERFPLIHLREIQMNVSRPQNIYPQFTCLLVAPNTNSKNGCTRPEIDAP